MIGRPPPSPPGVARKLDRVELQMVNLRRELDAATEPAIRAAILYHMGVVYEHELGRHDEADTHYGRALEAAPSFQPASVARVRIAERDRASKDLDARFSSLASSAKDPAVVASSLVDLSLRSDDWSSLLQQAIEQSPEPVVPALILEWLAGAHGDADARRDALRAQAEHTLDPALRAALWLDLGIAEIENGEVDLALHVLELASEHDSVAWQARTLQRQTAYEHDRAESIERAAAALATLLGSGASADPLSLPVPEAERSAMAALLWREAAAHCAEPERAAVYLDQALELEPGDHVLRYNALATAERANDGLAIDAAATWFHLNEPNDPAFLAHQVRRLSTGGEHGVETLRRIAEAHPTSEYVEAALDVALTRVGATDARIDRWQLRAEVQNGDSRALLLWRAALLSVQSAGSETAAQELFTRAARASERYATAILRDALSAAIRANDAELAATRCDELLERDLDSDERAALAFCRYDVARRGLGDEMAADELLREALRMDPSPDWAPEVALRRALESGSPQLLAQAHDALAARSKGGTRAAHRCAEARAHATAGDWTSAEAALRSALEDSPADRYATTLLEEVLRRAGRPERIVDLAKARDPDAGDPADEERSLLLAGAAAEREGKLSAAREAYELALTRYPDSPSPALAWADLARRSGDAAMRTQAHMTLSQQALEGGVSELFALLAGDALNGAASTHYERALDHPATTMAAAAALLTLPRSTTSDEQRSAAEELFADADAPLVTTDQDDFDAAFTALREALGDPHASTGGAWLELAELAPNDRLRSAATLQGLREIRLVRGEAAVDDLFMLAQESEGLAADHPEAATAIDEVLAPGDDPELRDAALARKLEHSGALGRSSLVAARCRALVEADRGEEAVAILTSAIDERPDDLALWETLRQAGRQAGEWALVAQACERLAPFVEGELAADLLEEAGAVRLDCLRQYQQAEDLFRAALDADPTRAVAFRRLHDLLTDREDAESLEALVSARLALGGPKDRPDLLYERARLLRGFSDRPGALEVLDELFSAEPDHVGALALAAEVHVSLEQWEEAVECLRRLSRSEIPDEQRRVAHLGAADFLEKHLDAPSDALLELRAVERLGLADGETWLRIASLEEARGEGAAAIDAYGRVLETNATDATAVTQLANLQSGSDRERTLERYERAVWSEVEAGELEAALVEGARNVAAWRGQTERAAAIASLEAAIAPGSTGGVGRVDLSHVSIAAIWDRQANTRVDELIRHAGPSLEGARPRSKKLSPSDGVYAELDALTERLGARTGSIARADASTEVSVYVGTDGELHWLVPTALRDGLDARQRFEAGRLAWAAPRGAAALLRDSPERGAGMLAAVVRSARGPIAEGGPILPMVSVKVRRAARKRIRQALGESPIDTSALLEAVGRMQRTADRAGLLAGGDIAMALEILLGGRPSSTALGASLRGLDLVRFWCAPDSPLWRADD